MKINLKYIYNSKKGIKREKNQDRIFIVEKDNYYIFMIFDGVSSYPFSYLFINEFKKQFRSKFKKLQISEVNLSEILYQAHNDVLNLGIKGMSTVSILFFDNKNKNIGFINIGDSRIYIFTNQFLEKITKDDSLLGRKNIITKYLGLESLNLNDFKMKKLDFGFNFLICTDGFYGLMENNLKEYFEAFNFKNFKNIERKLTTLQKRKNKDDSSYIIIKNEISD
ncbi:MAG: protein phosphatase 2C domain-containing protein [Lutibacter sp.]|nr:protein phosphatase 2C domain-containing protein [Lutibacter sp.]